MQFGRHGRHFLVNARADDVRDHNDHYQVQSKASVELSFHCVVGCCFYSVPIFEIASLCLSMRHNWIKAVSAKIPPMIHCITFWLAFSRSTISLPPKIKMQCPMKVLVPMPAI